MKLANYNQMLLLMVDTLHFQIISKLKKGEHAEDEEFE